MERIVLETAAIETMTGIKEIANVTEIEIAEDHSNMIAMGPRLLAGTAVLRSKAIVRRTEDDKTMVQTLIH